MVLKFLKDYKFQWQTLLFWFFEVFKYSSDQVTLTVSQTKTFAAFFFGFFVFILMSNIVIFFVVLRPQITLGYFCFQWSFEAWCCNENKTEIKIGTLNKSEISGFHTVLRAIWQESEYFGYFWMILSICF